MHYANLDAILQSQYIVNNVSNYICAEKYVHDNLHDLLQYINIAKNSYNYMCALRLFARFSADQKYS